MEGGVVKKEVEGKGCWGGGGVAWRINGGMRTVCV